MSATMRSLVDDAIRRIRFFASAQIHGMAILAADQGRRDCLSSIAACVEKRLSELAEILNGGAISPFRKIRLSESSPPVSEKEPPLRIGVYPLAANPLHWGHLLVGLTSLVAMRLDSVVFVIAGSDARKPGLVPSQIRHRLARDVIETFQPFFSYSPIALGTDLDGEMNLGRLFALNPGVPLHAFYIAGADHYRRWNEQGTPDTIEKLEQVAREHASDSSRAISAVFIDRPDQRTGAGSARTRSWTCTSFPPCLSSAHPRLPVRRSAGTSSQRPSRACRTPRLRKFVRSGCTTEGRRAERTASESPSGRLSAPCRRGNGWKRCLGRRPGHGSSTARPPSGSAAAGRRSRRYGRNPGLSGA